VYDSSGNFFEAGKGAIRRVERPCLDLDRLISKAAGVKTGRKNRYKRRRMNAAIQRARQLIQNLVSDFHGRLAHDLTSRYNVILIPTFDVSKMVLNQKRKINSETARNMLNWSHYKFKQ
jgi:putative transposase